MTPDVSGAPEALMAAKAAGETIHKGKDWTPNEFEKSLLNMRL